jgi:hypothetical protein
MFEKSLEKYRHVAEKLGLRALGTFDGGDFHIEGRFEGMPIRLYFGTDAVCTEAAHGVPNGLGVEVATKSLVLRLAHVFGSGFVELGDPAFDKAFFVKTTDSARAARWLTPEARRVLLELAEQDVHPSIDDELVKIWRYTSIVFEPEDAIEYDLRATARVARLLTDSATV